MKNRNGIFDNKSLSILMLLALPGFGMLMIALNFPVETDGFVNQTVVLVIGYVCLGIACVSTGTLISRYVKNQSLPADVKMGSKMETMLYEAGFRESEERVWKRGKWIFEFETKQQGTLSVTTNEGNIVDVHNLVVGVDGVHKNMPNTGLKTVLKDYFNLYM
jgi:hypothetical protein